MFLLSYAPMSDENVAAMNGIGVNVLGTAGNFHLKKFWLTLRDLRFVRSVLKREKIDILHSHFLGTNVWYSALSGFRPHVVTVMGGDVIGENWRPSTNIQGRLLTPYALRNADALTAWSTMLAERVRPFSRNGIGIEIVHGGIELERFNDDGPAVQLRQRLGIPEGGRIVFSPRLIRRLYNIDQIADAAGKVCEQLPDTYFVIALPSMILDDEYVTQVKEIFAAAAARDRVRYVPTIKHDEIPDYFRIADVTVSIPDTDGTPMTVLESMACGTPTVIGNLPDYDTEYFEHDTTTLMVDVKDPTSIADAIIRYLTDSELKDRITKEARRRVLKTGGYEYQMNKMELIYKSLIPSMKLVNERITG